MAGDWISMRHDLADDPAALRIAAHCGIPRQHVVGCLHAVWSWFDKHTTDGKAALDRSFIDELAGVPGFADAMERAGWLCVTERGVQVPKFQAFMSQSAKARQLTARRVAKHRKRKCNAPGVTESLPQYRTAEPEKRRKENRSSADGAGAEQPESSTEPTDAAAPLAGIVSNKHADAAAGRNGGAVVLEIQDLLAERGCDVSFRTTVARYADVRVVRKLTAEFDQKRDKIANKGGWWRDRLRRQGVKAI